MQYTEKKLAPPPAAGEGVAKPPEESTKPATNPAENCVPASHDKKWHLKLLAAVPAS